MPREAAFESHHGKSRARLLAERCTPDGGANWLLRGTIASSLLLLFAAATNMLQVIASTAVGKDLLGPIMNTYAPLVTGGLACSLLAVTAASLVLRRQLMPAAGRTAAQAAETASGGAAARVIELGFWALLVFGLACLALAVDLFSVPVHPPNVSSRCAAPFCATPQTHTHQGSSQSYSVLF